MRLSDLKSAAAGIIGLTMMVTAASAAAMSGIDINREIIGHRVYLAVPMGGEFPLFYHKDGSVYGDGRQVGLGRYLAPTETGKWWIDGNQLCEQFKTWYNGNRLCFSLDRIDATHLKWTRDDGEAGVARIGN